MTSFVIQSSYDDRVVPPDEGQRRFFKDTQTPPPDWSGFAGLGTAFDDARYYVRQERSATIMPFEELVADPRHLFAPRDFTSAVTLFVGRLILHAVSKPLMLFDGAAIYANELGLEMVSHDPPQAVSFERTPIIFAHTVQELAVVELLIRLRQTRT